jgi:hypothetical protein
MGAVVIAGSLPLAAVLTPWVIEITAIATESRNAAAMAITAMAIMTRES